MVAGPPSGMAACTGTAVLSRSPVALSALHEITPLGNLNPTGHVFPSDHIYFIAPAGTIADVVAPANIVISNVARQTRSGGGLPNVVDYIMTFFPCADVQFYFAHLGALSATVLAQVGSFDTSCNASYVTGGLTYQQCYKALSIPVTAGTPIATMIGGLDWGGYDRRTPVLGYVDPARTVGGNGDFTSNHTICPIDYVTSDVAGPMRALFGGRGARRTMEPVCGQVMQDVASTAQGRWYFGTAQQDDPHLALVHDNVDPTQGMFSVGSSIASLPSGVYGFKPASSGRVNADFSRVTADGNVYCYESPGQWVRASHILLRMPSVSSLEIGAANGASCGDPATWSLSGVSAQFAR